MILSNKQILHLFPSHLKGLIAWVKAQSVAVVDLKLNFISFSVHVGSCLCVFSCQMTEIDFTEDKENFKWKGHGPLLPKEGSVSIPAGFKLQTGLQLIPAAPVSALAVETGWGLLAAGTIHGFILYDFMNKKTVTTKWTVSQGRSEIISLDVLFDFPCSILELVVYFSF